LSGETVSDPQKEQQLACGKLKYFSSKNREIKDRQEKMPQIEIEGEVWEQCANCGHIWDGYAQCHCWQMGYDDAAESGYETD
jgi:hypothetical protein